VAFRIAVGGATGHKSFARDLGVIVPPSEIVEVVVALILVYIAHGNRGNRKSARLKHLLETWTLDQYLDAAENLVGRKLCRSPLDPSPVVSTTKKIPHSHIGAYPQKQAGLHYLGIAVPVGQLTPGQFERVADIADRHGSGEIRLTVWQNFILPNIPEISLEAVKNEIREIGFDWKQSNLASGVIACTGNTYCKFSLTGTKAHALALIEYLEPRVQLDVPVNIHFTGCPHSCAQHYIGDIGLLGVKTKDRREAYHVFIGGGFGRHQAVARQIAHAVPFDEVKPLVETILLTYLENRNPGESFQAFTARHEQTLEPV
jgi:ferredoxin-nitrite reductase